MESTPGSHDYSAIETFEIGNESPVRIQNRHTFGI